MYADDFFSVSVLARSFVQVASQGEEEIVKIPPSQLARLPNEASTVTDYIDVINFGILFRYILWQKQPNHILYFFYGLDILLETFTFHPIHKRILFLSFY